MNRRKYPATKDRRDIGSVEFPIEKMLAAREASSCCIGAEALLEINATSIRNRIKQGGIFSKTGSQVD